MIKTFTNMQQEIGLFAIYQFEYIFFIFQGNITQTFEWILFQASILWIPRNVVILNHKKAKEINFWKIISDFFQNIFLM